MTLPARDQLASIAGHCPQHSGRERRGRRRDDGRKKYAKDRGEDAGGFDALDDRKPRPKRVWNRIPDEIRDKVIERALEEPELLPHEVAVAFTATEKTFVSEASVYRILKAESLVTSPAFIVMKAADALLTRPPRSTSSGRPTSPTSRSRAGGWFYLSTVLDDFSRYIVAWKLCTTR